MDRHFKVHGLLKKKRKTNLGKRPKPVNDISPSPEAACESQSNGLSDCTLHAN